MWTLDGQLARFLFTCSMLAWFFSQLGGHNYNVIIISTHYIGFVSTCHNPPYLLMCIVSLHWQTSIIVCTVYVAEFFSVVLSSICSNCILAWHRFWLCFRESLSQAGNWSLSSSLMTDSSICLNVSRWYAAMLYKPSTPPACICISLSLSLGSTDCSITFTRCGAFLHTPTVHNPDFLYFLSF